MKYTKYLIITFLIFIMLLTAFLYTKNIFYFYSTIPIIICASIIGYFQEKNKLSIKTNKILNLLKYERIFYTFAVIIPYIVSFTYKIEKVENYFTIAYITSVVFLLLYAIKEYIKKYLFFKFDRKLLNVFKYYSNSICEPLILII